MILTSCSEKTPVAEALLPLVFFADEKIFYAAGFAPVAAGISMLVLQWLRGRLSANEMRAFLILWLAVCGGAAWMAAGIPAYWCWSLYLLIPAALMTPADAKRRGFIFSVKKYASRRIRALLAGLGLAVLFAGAVFFLRRLFPGPEIWLIAIFVLIVGETLSVQIGARKK